MTSIFSAIIVVVALLTTVKLLQCVRDPLRRLPGPFLARFTRLWLVKQAWYGDFHHVNLDLHKRYGPVVRIRPNEYSIDDPSAVRALYGAGTKFIKGSWYNGSTSATNPHVNIFALQDPKIHSNLRKKYSSFYSISTLVKYEPFVDANTARLSQRLKAFAESAEKMDLMNWFQCYAFDVITEITLGYPFGFLDRGEDIDHLMFLADRNLTYAAIAGFFPSLHLFLGKYLKFDPSDALGSYAFRVVNGRPSPDLKASKDGPAGFLNLYMEKREKDPDMYTFQAGVGLLAQNIAAGSDTTGISLAATFFWLLRHPRCLQKLLKEIRETYPEKDEKEFFTFQQAQNLPYLQAVIKESLRLHPAVGLPMARRVPKGGATVAGVDFPEGTVVGINAWVAHKNQEVYGPDVEDFRPERWLEAEPETLSEMERYFLAFGNGSRTCIGKNISLLEMNKLVPYVIRNFDFELHDPSQWLDSSCDWFVKPHSLNASVKERKQSI